MSNDLSRRLITTAVAVPLLIFLFFVGGIPFMILIIVVGFIGLYEMDKIGRAKGLEFRSTLLFIMGFAVYIAAYVDSKYLGIKSGLAVFSSVVFFSCLTILVYEMLMNKPQGSIKTFTGALFVHLYVNVSLSCIILLRNIGFGNSITLPSGLYKSFDLYNENIGTFFVFFTVAATFIADAGAYFAGRMFGRTRLAPLISPKKTVEGAVGGMLAACLAGVGVKFIDKIFFRISNEFSYSNVLILAAIIGVTGIFGDLFESMVKRDANIKDTGGILPGHGGMMDRLDSLLFTIPFTYFYVKIYYNLF
ncbi:MAG TPA: phosphatidate cytidylyltransferase [bacterium]